MPLSTDPYKSNDSVIFSILLLHLHVPWLEREKGEVGLKSLL